MHSIMGFPVAGWKDAKSYRPANRYKCGNNVQLQLLYIFSQPSWLTAKAAESLISSNQKLLLVSGSIRWLGTSRCLKLWS